jgi:DNA polymerase I-like protein with 3'-5' exonuclease and polymerase domains
MPTDDLGNFVDPDDFHGYSASLVFGKPLIEVAKRRDKLTGLEINPPQKKFRQMAKIATFAVFYGAQAHGSFTDRVTNQKIEYGLYLQLGISKKEAEEVLERYYEAYKVALDVLTKTGEEAFAQGYVRGAIGRIRHLEKTSKNGAGRKARNYVIQETNASQMKYALFLARKEMPKDEVRILSTVHDEMVIEAVEDKAEMYAKQLQGLMIKAANKILPGPVEYGASYNVEDYWTK